MKPNRISMKPFIFLSYKLQYQSNSLRLLRLELMYWKNGLKDIILEKNKLLNIFRKIE